MMQLTVLLTFAQFTLAASGAATLADADATHTFKDFQETVNELSEQKQDSLTEFKEKRWAIENAFKEYCESMLPYKSISTKCIQIKKSATEKLDSRERHLAATLPEDKFLDSVNKMDAFNTEQQELSAVREGEEQNADDFHLHSVAFVGKMSEYCPKAPKPQLVERCERQLTWAKFLLQKHEDGLRTLTPDSRPLNKKIYRAKSPVLRCFLRLPPLGNASLEYAITDPTGRYRYEHITKTKFGNAFDVPLSYFTETKVSEPRSILKKFVDPKNSKAYEAQIYPAYHCSANTPKRAGKCSVGSLAISLIHSTGSESALAAKARFPIKIDSPFELSLPLDSHGQEEFTLDCVIASQIRKGEWIYSDRIFDTQ